MTKYNDLPRKIYELDPSEYHNTFEEYMADLYQNVEKEPDKAQDIANIREYIVELKAMPDKEIIYLWETFSQNLVNCANYLYVDELTIRKFKEWLDEDNNERQL